MSRTLNVPDNVYARLEAAARDRGLASVEQFLEQWPPQTEMRPNLSEEEQRQRQELVDEIDSIRAEAMTACGVMPDSVELIWEDRAR